MSNIKPRDEETGLFPAQVKAVNLLLEEPRLDKIAEKLQISRSTLWLWLRRDSRFRLHLAEREAEELAAAARKLVTLCTLAAETLERAMRDNPDDKVSARALQAANVTLKRTPDLIQSAALNVRLAQLERLLSGDEPRPEDPA